ncbi:MAG TPA: glycosyltransferase family 2 protein [Candidatus Acidoferrales bacterium]|nr:glycosyltransferase family 2 protein [Candidatus Acidoferrales bacterium]
MIVSILIPTCNRAQSLGRLMESLRAMSCDNANVLEIVVVDNGSSDGTSELLDRELGRPRSFELKVLREPEKGKARALNRGLAAAMGDLFLVLDDDVVADRDCLLRHVEAYEGSSFAAVQGKILPGCDVAGQPADPARLREYNIPHIDYGEQMLEIRGLTGTNMSFKREVFAKVGFFDVRLGPGAAGFSEDTEYSIRIRQAGFKIGYIPGAVVYHELNPGRYGREYNRMVEYRKGLSRSLYRRDSIPFRVIPDLAANCLRYGFYRLLGKTQKAYKTEGRIMKCWGYLAGKRHGVTSKDSHSQV